MGLWLSYNDYKLLSVFIIIDELSTIIGKSFKWVEEIIDSYEVGVQSEFQSDRILKQEFGKTGAGLWILSA